MLTITTFSGSLKHERNARRKESETVIFAPHCRCVSIALSFPQSDIKWNAYLWGCCLRGGRLISTFEWPWGILLYFLRRTQMARLLENLVVLQRHLLMFPHHGADGIFECNLLYLLTSARITNLEHTVYIFRESAWDESPPPFASLAGLAPSRKMW